MRQYCGPFERKIGIQPVGTPADFAICPDDADRPGPLFLLEKPQREAVNAALHGYRYTSGNSPLLLHRPARRWCTSAVRHQGPGCVRTSRLRTNHACTNEHARVDANFSACLWLFAIYVGDRGAAAIGMVWIAGRIVYMVDYVAAAERRGRGFAI